jgi:hypothetical protein
MSRFTDFAGNLIEKTAGRIVRNAEALSQQEAAEAEQERMRNLKEKFAEFASNPKFLEFLKTDPTFDQTLLEREQTDDVIEEIMEHGFVIILNKPAPFDIEFDWLALAVKNPKIFSTISEAVSNTEVPVESIAETIPLDVVSSTSQNSSESVSVTSTVDVQPEIQAVPSSVLESVVEPVVVETVQPEGVSSTVSEP